MAADASRPLNSLGPEELRTLLMRALEQNVQLSRTVNAAESELAQLRGAASTDGVTVRAVASASAAASRDGHAHAHAHAHDHQHCTHEHHEHRVERDEPHGVAEEVARAASLEEARRRLARESVADLQHWVMSESRFTPTTRQVLFNSAQSPEFLDFLTAFMRRAMVTECLGRYLALSFTAKQLGALSTVLEKQISVEALDIFPGSKPFSVVVTDTVMEGRNLALRVAIERAVGRVRSGEHAPATPQQPPTAAASSSLPPPPPPPPPPGASPRLTPRATSDGKGDESDDDAQSTSSATSGRSMVNRTVSPGPKSVVYVSKGCDLLPHAARFSFTHDAIVRVVPLVNVTPHKDAVAAWSVDVARLQAEVQRDLAAGNVPCAVVATLGSHRVYQVDDLWELKRVCTAHGLWLHVEGSSVIFAAASRVPVFAMALFECADSICDDALAWFTSSSAQGTCGLLLLRKTSASSFFPEGRGVSSTSPLASLNSLSLFHARFRLWCHLLGGPRGSLQRMLDSGLLLCETLRQMLAREPLFRVVGPWERNHPEIVFFQAQPPPDLPLADANVDVNGLNEWLAQCVAPLLAPRSVSLYSFEGKEGFVLDALLDRERPMLPGADEVASHMAPLLNAIVTEMKRLRVALSLRREFEAFVAAQQPLLELVPVGDVEGLVGLGAFRFVPLVLAGERQLYQHEVSLASEALATRLHEDDPLLFAAAEAGERGLCVVVRASPAIDAASDANAAHAVVARIGALIVSRRDSLALPDAVQRKVAEVVRRGIEEAERHLHAASASAAAFAPAALIRKIPVVGGVWNWLLPQTAQPPNEAATSGATFDLRQGHVTHAQVQRRREPDAHSASPKQLPGPVPLTPQTSLSELVGAVPPPAAPAAPVPAPLSPSAAAAASTAAPPPQPQPQPPSPTASQRRHSEAREAKA